MVLMSRLWSGFLAWLAPRLVPVLTRVLHSLLVSMGLPSNVIVVTDKQGRSEARIDSAAELLRKRLKQGVRMVLVAMLLGAPFFSLALASDARAANEKYCQVSLYTPGSTLTYLLLEARRDGPWLIGQVVAPQGQTRTILLQGTIVAVGNCPE